MNINDLATKRKITGKVLIQPTGYNANEYFDSGDVLTVAIRPEIQRSNISHWDKGFRRRRQHLVDEIAWMYEADMNEQHAETLKLLHLATQGADVSQSLVAAPAGTATILDVQKGRTYSIGKKNLDTVTVQVSAVAKVEGTDYELELGAGLIRILPGGSINDDDDIDLTFGHPAMTFEQFEAEKDILTIGKVMILEYDQHAEDPVAVHEFTAQYYITDWGSNDGRAVNQFKLTMLAQTKPVITVRK